MKVSKLIHKTVVTCRSTDTLERAAELMWEHDIGCVPVIDQTGGVAGIVTDRDICMAAYTRGEPLRTIPVTTAMAHTVYSCAPDDDLNRVEREMSRRQIRRMPVLDSHGHAIGIVSLNDIARASQGGNAVSASEVASTLAAVCAPRAQELTSAA
jgi:CBS domain-containing protein